VLTDKIAMKKKILVFDKNRDILDMIEIILTQEGYEVDPVCFHNQVSKRIEEFKPDAILLDVVNPTAEGTELCEAIKNAEDTSHIPVIVLSTHPKVNVVKEICADEVVAKPFDIDFLVAVVEQQLISA
jgi:DNA-binding response OmpR family regulator